MRGAFSVSFSHGVLLDGCSALRLTGLSFVRTERGDRCKVHPRLMGTIGVCCEEAPAMAGRL